MVKTKRRGRPRGSKNKPPPPSQGLAEWMTVEQTANYLQVSTMTIHRWIKAGRIETSQIVPKGKHLIAAATIEALTEVRARTGKESDG